jgi:hypothetical protein
MNIFTYVKNKLMGFTAIFKESNDYNEKTVIGFMSLDRKSVV